MKLTLRTDPTVVNGSIQGIDIRNGTIKSIDIGNGTVTGADIRNGTVGVVDVVPALQPLFARVGNDAEDNPVLVAGRGVTSVVKRDADLSYLVTFNRSIAACGWTATINNNYFGPPPGWGVI